MIIDLETGRTVAGNQRFAKSFFSRFAGLMCRRKFPEGCDALIFDHCSSIHCFFMRMEIDVLFINRYGKVLKAVHRLKPWHLAFGPAGSCCVIELPAGTLEHSRTVPGDLLKFE